MGMNFYKAFDSLLRKTLFDIAHLESTNSSDNFVTAHDDKLVMLIHTHS